MLIDRDMKKKELCAKAGISTSSLTKMGKGGHVTTEVLIKICTALECTVDDIMDRSGLPLLGIVPEDGNVTLAAAFEKPLIQYTKKGAAAACGRIAQRIKGYNVPITI